MEFRQKCILYVYANYAQNWSKVIDYEFRKYANYSKSIIDTKTQT